MASKMSTPNGSDHLSALRVCIASIQALLENFKASLKRSITDPQKTTVINPPQNPLALLSTAAVILKAQTTKLSLLILNAPFTPSAITHILNSLSASILPALMTALELCLPSTHSALLHNHVRTLLSRAFRAISALLLVAIPQQDDKHSSSTAQRREKALAATGMLWETCDGMTQLASTGLPTLAIEKLDTSHSLLKDAIAELEEWDPNDEDEDEDDPDTDFNNTDDASDLLPIPLPSLSQIPQLRKLTLRLLRQIRLLYSPLKKRRLRSFPPLTLLSSSEPTLSQIKTLDTIITAFGDDFTSTADEVACALYSHDDKEVLRLLLFLREKACASLEVVVLDWRGEEDEFSVQARKWVEVMRGMDIGEGIRMAEEKEEKEDSSYMGNGKKGMIELLQQQQQQEEEDYGSSSFKSKLPIR